MDSFKKLNFWQGAGEGAGEETAELEIRNPKSSRKAGRNKSK